MRPLAMMSHASSIFISTAIALFVSGCLVEPAPTHRGPSPSPDVSGTPAPSSTAPPPVSPPPRIALDSGRTLSADPGAGAGIFITYQSGGHWSLYWTCDTNASGNACAFDVSVSARAIHGYSASPLSATVSQDGASFRARTVTSATLDGVSFDTDPGGAIVVSATLNGAPHPDLVFFVSSGKLATAPTDPIELVPTSP